MTPTTSEGTILYHALKMRYKDPAELKQLMFQIGVASELFQYSELEYIRLSLIVFLEKYGWLGCLVNNLKKNSPSTRKFPPKISSLSCPPNIKVQVVLSVSHSLNQFTEQKEKLSVIFGVQAEKLVVMAAANNPLRLLLTLPRKHVDILSVLQNCLEYEDYLLSVTPFRLLSPLAQMAWQRIAWYEPFHLDNDVLTPAITWQEALLTAVQNPPTPPPHVSPPLAEQPPEPAPSPPPSTPPPAAQPAKPFPPPPIIPPVQAASPPSPPQTEDVQETPPVEDIAPPVINLGGKSSDQPSSPPDAVEEE